jgi:ERCC4-type nuclease
MSSLKLLIDNPEDDHLKAMIDKSGLFKEIIYESRQLNVGDFVFTIDEKPIFIIERKTIADLASSVKSKTGRYREQKYRLCHDTGLPRDRIMYLIEGYQQKCNDDNICGLPKMTILSCFVNTIARDRLHVYHTKDQFETCLFLAKLHRSLAENNGGAETDYLDIHKIGIKKDKLTPNLVYCQQLAMIPGISANMAKAIANEYKSFPDLITAWAKTNEPKKMLANIIVNSKRLGNIRSERVFQYFFAPMHTAE